MLTIIAHMVFWPALLWNMVFWIVAFTHGFKRHNLWADFKSSVFSLAILLIPGIYLFGIY